MHVQERRTQKRKVRKQFRERALTVLGISGGGILLLLAAFALIE